MPIVVGGCFKLTNPRHFYRIDAKALKFFVAFVAYVVLLKFQLVQVVMLSLEPWTPCTQSSLLMRYTGETATLTLSPICAHYSRYLILNYGNTEILNINVW